MEYILYCDESSDKGPKFGDFYGGCLVGSNDLRMVVDALEAEKQTLHLFGEIKWTKVTEAYLGKYMAMMTLFFRFVREGKIKVRIMYRAMKDIPASIVRAGDDDKYFKLYYQFIKHAFGLRSIPSQQDAVTMRVYLDQLPDKREKCTRFKEYVLNLPNTKDFSDSPIRIRSDDIAEVDSREHVLLQCTDVVLGAMFFRLNELHRIVPEGSNRRGKRTVAKEKLYKHILSEICLMMPGFNVGISTGAKGLSNPSWDQAYAHWQFKPK